MAQSHAHSQTLGAGKLVLAIAVFVGVGIPLLAYVWETINLTLSGHFRAARVPLTIVAFVLLLGVFKLASLTLTRWEGERK